MSPTHRAVYLETMALLRAHARGDYVYAGPDTPEIYALTGLRNPTRSLFDYLDPTGSARGERLLRTLRSRGVTAIVINARPGFSDPLRPRTVAVLRTRYPFHQRIGAFDVRWRTWTPTPRACSRPPRGSRRRGSRAGRRAARL